MIFVAADHGGFALKQGLVQRLTVRYGPIVRDLTPRRRADDDYPLRAADLATAVRTSGSLAFGIGICRSGVGMAMVANKFPNIRAVQGTSTNIAAAARQDENANIISLGADDLSAAQAWKIVTTFLETSWRPVARYRRRLGEIRRYEQGRR